ncbi:glycerophosphodiester phosphodiesterase family protein [Acinetobacter sp. TY1]|uniref:glycerophosphodiester phosphodiesterase family protein n=1 Tax=Acinetobacter sp. TY1 TaxID=3387626 RepID=UPI003AF63310
MKISLLSSALFGCIFFFSPFSQAVEIHKNRSLEQTENLTENTTKILYQVDFVQQQTLPQQWRIPGNNPGNISIQNGVLQIDGRANDIQPTSILLPSSLEQQQNYRIDVEFSLDQPLNSSRWGSVMYDVVTTQGIIPNTYYQFTVRSDVTAKNGTEFGNRKSNGQWNVIEAKSGQTLKEGQSYQASIVVHGNRVQHYLNGQLMQDVEIDQQHLRGDIGLSATGIIMKIRKISISEQNAALSELKTSASAIQNTAFQLSAPPTLIQSGIGDVKATSASFTQANQYYYQLDNKLRVLDATGKVIGDLKSLLETRPKNKIFAFDIADIRTIDALKQFVPEDDLSDITLISKDAQILVEAHQKLPALRTALDLSQYRSSKKRPENLAELVVKTNAAYSKIMILPAQGLDKPSVSYLQRRLMTVWTKQNVTDHVQAATILTTGVNGILSQNSNIYAEVLKKFPKNTLLRRPLIIGHRGVPSLEDENTLESATHAVTLGADIIENDIYLTKDQHLVVMHDNTVNRTTKGTGKIEEMTLAEVQQLRTSHKNYHVPTLAEYFIWLKKNKNTVLMIEIKSSQPTLVQALKAEITKYDVVDQVVTTSFNRDQIQQVKTNMNHVSAGVLVGSLPNAANKSANVKYLLADAQKYVASYHPSYRADLVNIFNEAQQRGVSFWPWNLNDTTFKQLYIAGLNGVTTNDIHKYSNWIVDVQANTQMNMKVGQASAIPLSLKAQNGAMLKALATHFIVLKGSPNHKVENGQLIFTDKGTAYVVAGYSYQIDAQNTYYLYSQPIKMIVN